MKKDPHHMFGGEELVDQWNDRDSFGRLQLIMDNSELFWDLRLITRSEIEMVMAMSESAKEYIVSREIQPIFTSLNLKATLEAQLHRKKLEAALSAVFLNHDVKMAV